MSSLQLRLAKKEMSGALKHQTKALLHLNLLQFKPKASTQQIIAANILGTLCHLSSAAFLDTVIFSALDQLSRKMEQQIDAINKVHQSEITVINKGKLVCIDPPDDSPKMEMDMDTMHQSTVAQSTLSPPSPPIIENSTSPSSTASPDSTLVSHTLKPLEPKKTSSVILPTRQVSKNDKGLTGSTKRTKLQDGCTGTNNIIITGYQPEQEESQLLLDLIIYDIPAKWSNYELLTNLNN
ncbi:hypothetical protein RCL_jg14676.t1 [Rhizophagus clarus]|uniref:Uncharacterized protein n=1 Tax=Rhizophagus clarus TaxID=94130 RepID=A0A8H3M315_9GLOM|nr:hypothetical protein RCL_jg14676.t1 [Rhizophagus clarus]